VQQSFLDREAFWKFARSIRVQRRYVRDSATGSFLHAVVGSARSRETSVPVGAAFWRAQLGTKPERAPTVGELTEDFVQEPFDDARMKPLPDRATEGRLNPKGIPVLYVATHQATAVAEVRPWKGSFVSVGKFQSTRLARIVDATRTTARGDIGQDQMPAAELEKLIWGDIDHMLSRPTTRADDMADYAPTQVIAEVIREAGYDGIAYRSSYGIGHNIAFFDINVAKQISRHVVRVTDLTLALSISWLESTDCMEDSPLDQESDSSYNTAT